MARVYSRRMLALLSKAMHASSFMLDICLISFFRLFGPQGGRQDHMRKKDGRGGCRVASGAGRPATGVVVEVRVKVEGGGGQQWLSHSFDKACPSLTPPATPAPPTSQPLWRDETFCSFSMTDSADWRCSGSFVRLRQTPAGDGQKAQLR